MKFFCVNGMLFFMILRFNVSQRAWDGDPTLVWCWSIVCGVGPKLRHGHCLDVLYLLELFEYNMSVERETLARVCLAAGPVLVQRWNKRSDGVSCFFVLARCRRRWTNIEL